MKAAFQKHILNFRFEAGTSRGVLNTKSTWYLILKENNHSDIQGIGEAGPLKGLSIDDREDMEEKLAEVCARLDGYTLEELEEANLVELLDLREWPSIVFALETALLDLKNGGKRLIADTAFSKGSESIPINGLIWMGQRAFMETQIEQKLEQGYDCLKLKIGAIDFDTECEILASIRKKFGPEKITLRVDANGAFAPAEALDKLKRLAEFELHSIEQPIKQRQIDAMRVLCEKTPVPIALDEELIGVAANDRRRLLEDIRPQFIILKPTLIGGLKASKAWIELAEELQIGWWITSALESNIGLNAIAQFTSTLEIKNNPQGLGTGQLYSNNIESPLVIQEGKLFYFSHSKWDFSGVLSL